MRQFAMTGMLAVLVAASATCAAAERFTVQTRDVVAQQQTIRADLEAPSGRYAQMPAAKRQQVLADQDRLLRLLDGTTSTADLPEGRKTEVFNLIESITTALNADDDDDRMVCTREARTGSNFMTRVCRSAAQIRLEKDAADSKMKQANQRICNTRGECG